MKKIISVFFMISLSGALLLGCQSQESSSDDSVTLTVWDSYGTTSPIKPLISKFEEENPNINIEFVPIPFDNFYDKLAVGATGGELPDVATTGIMWAPQYVEYDIYADLSQFANGEINGNDINKVFSKGMLDAAKKDGKLHGIPYDFDSYALYYRKDLLKEAGVENPPKNWDEFVSIGKQLTKDKNGDGKIDQYAFMSQLTWEHWEPFLRANGGKFLNDDRTKAVFNSPEAIESLRFFSDLFNKHQIAIPWTAERGQPTKGLKKELFAMFINGPWFMGLMEENAPEQSGKWEVAKPLEKKQMGTHIGGTYLSAFKKSEHKKEAWKFIEFLLKEENAKNMYPDAGPAYLPASEELSEDPDEYFGGTKPLETFNQVVKKGKPNPIVSEWQEITLEIEEAIESVVISEKDPKKELDKAAEEVNKLLAE